MSPEIQDLILHIYDKCVEERIIPVYNIFKEYFGEERVDLQNSASMATVLRDMTDFLYSSLVVTENEDGKYVFQHYNETHYNETHSPVIYDLYSLSELDTEQLKNILDNSIIKSKVFSLKINASSFCKNIIIHFPEVIITNERGQSTKVKHLFVKVGVTLSGKLSFSDGFKINRTHYTYAHYINDYMHSHVPGIGTPDKFLDCCKGSGPITTTINNLRSSYNESQWLQLCWDIDKYVTIESLSGVPYRKLMQCRSIFTKGQELVSKDTVSCTNVLSSPNIISTQQIYSFIEYLINNKSIPFIWANGRWEIACSTSDLFKIISIAFLEWYKNEDNKDIDLLLRVGILVKVIIFGNKIYKPLDNVSIRRRLMEQENGQLALTFKGVEYRLEIEAPNLEEENCHVQYVLSPVMVSSIVGVFLHTLNIYYEPK